MSVDVAKETPDSAVLAEAPLEPIAAPNRKTAPLVATALAAGALAVALVAALWFGTGWLQAAFFTDGPRAAARDSALDAARQAALNMTTMRLDDIPGSLALARSSMTGAILVSAEQNVAQSEQLARRTGVEMTSKVLGSALTSLNTERDKAAALIVLQVTETKPGNEVSNYRYTWNLEMTKDKEIWKAEQVASLTQPALLDGPVAGTAPQEEPR
ncbi:hypothetical protein [Nocardia goodfellowii]|uniref:Mce-associated membrane protein n=1 Tax=Nocardia goodfellowii TaxID=882446 RepID=A0ABS4QBB3_9NOCA|nr:hypothetical protein [Nocardia goodfellowii]MBP2188863.1 Mce-associated membrane protein [Nocardia goodfellowii]